MQMLLAWLVLSGGLGDVPGAPVLNFSHLDHLTEAIAFMGDSVSIVHIYANYPDYRWVSAQESGPEGIACVDDAARAAVLLLRHFELQHDHSSLARARPLLRFLMYMQSEDGNFCNFILPDHSINTTGRTSVRSFGWWAARGLWAMATGARVLKESDPGLAEELARRVERMLPHVSALLQNYGQVLVRDEYRIPQWLLYASGADVSSELLLGLLEYHQAHPDSALETMIRKLCDGLMVMQDGDGKTFPYCLHRSWETQWHMWGNAQTQALASSGVRLGDSAMISSAVREARGFYSRLLMDGFIKELDVSRPGSPVIFDQIAYCVRPMAVGLIRLYEATANREYLIMAGLASSWLSGNNVTGRRMYDPSTGRCFDGITDSVTINMNAGAESTIEALMTLQEIGRYPDAARFARYRKIASGSSASYAYALFRAPGNTEVTLARERATGLFTIYEGIESIAFRTREHIQ